MSGILSGYWVINHFILSDEMKFSVSMAQPSISGHAVISGIGQTPTTSIVCDLHQARCKRIPSALLLLSLLCRSSLYRQYADVQEVHTQHLDVQTAAVGRPKGHYISK